VLPGLATFGAIEVNGVDFASMSEMMSARASRLPLTIFLSVRLAIVVVF
jgi:hypothetical protein